MEDEKPLDQELVKSLVEHTLELYDLSRQMTTALAHFFEKYPQFQPDGEFKRATEVEHDEIR